MKRSPKRAPVFEVIEPRLLLCNGPVLDAGITASILTAISDAGGMVRTPAGLWTTRRPFDIRHAVSDMFRDYGNTVAGANAVRLKASGQVTVNGTIGYTGDVDVFALAAPKAGSVKLTLEANGWGNRLLGSVSVYDADGDMLASGAQARKGGAVALSFKVTAGNAYYIKVKSQNEALGRYGMKLAFVPGAANQPPAAADDAYAVDEDNTLTASVGVLANDSDLEGDELAAVLASAPQHGSLAFNADGTFTYVPTANFNGTDSFTYKASDGQADSNVACVTLTVNPVNDAPVAQDDAYTMDENGRLAPTTSLLAIASDVDGDPLTAVLVSGPSHGLLELGPDGMFTYVPEAGFTGTDSFAYKASDGQADSNVATIAMTVNSVNEAPVAQDDGYSVDQDNVLTASVTALNTCAVAGSMPATSVGVLNNDNDPNGDPLTAVLVGGPANGTLTLNPDGTFTYTPKAGWVGIDTFTYKANDGEADSNVATVSIEVRPNNRPPVANDDSYAVRAGTNLNVPARGILVNDTDAEGDLLFAMLVGPGVQHGRLYLDSVGSFLYMPNGGFTGIDTFTYCATDMYGISNVATVTINVLPVA
jgi:VCBS repeat-containing protein